MTGFCDKQFRETKKRLKSAISKWHKTLGLGWWKVDYRYYNTLTSGDRSLNGNILATCSADWRYMTADICFAVESIWGAELDDEAIEALVVHEMCHILVNEMREDGIDHEERVTETLARAFVWARNEGVTRSRMTPSP